MGSSCDKMQLKLITPLAVKKMHVDNRKQILCDFEKYS